MEQMETAAEAKAARGPKAFIRRELSRIHTPATATGQLGPPGANARHLAACLCEGPECHSTTAHLHPRQHAACAGYASVSAELDGEHQRLCCLYVIGTGQWYIYV